MGGASVRAASAIALGGLPTATRASSAITLGRRELRSSRDLIQRQRTGAQRLVERRQTPKRLARLRDPNCRAVVATRDLREPLRTRRAPRRPPVTTIVRRAHELRQPLLDPRVLRTQRLDLATTRLTRTLERLINRLIHRHEHTFETTSTQPPTCADTVPNQPAAGGRAAPNMRRFAERASDRNANNDPRHRPRARLPPVHGAGPARVHRAADDGERVGLHGSRPAGARVHRRDGGPLVRERRLRETGDRRRPARAGAAPVLLPLVLVDGDGRPRPARRATARARTRADVEGLLRQQRVRRERHAGQARVVLQQRARPPCQEEDHRARPWLPRRHDRVCQPHGTVEHARRASTCRCR